MFAELNVEAGNEIQGIVEKMQQQSGINDALSKELTEIGQQSKKLYDETTMELMMRMIQKRKTFADHQMMYALDMAIKQNENILESELWLKIRSTCSQIVQNGTKTDWTWLKLRLLPSMIWYKDISKDSNDEPHYLYFELLKLVNVEALNQINNLDENLMEMADKQKDDWLALVEWKSDTQNEYGSARQDVIKNGITSPYTFDQLLASSGVTFNSPSFYDYNQYLSQLVLLAQIGTPSVFVYVLHVYKNVFIFHMKLQSMRNFRSQFKKSSELTQCRTQENWHLLMMKRLKLAW